MIHTLRQKRRRATRRRAAGVAPFLRLPNEGTTYSTYGWDATIGNMDDFPTHVYSILEKDIISIDNATTVDQNPQAGNPAGHNIEVDLGVGPGAIARLDIIYRFQQDGINTGEYVDLWNSNATAWDQQEDFTIGGAGDIRTYLRAITSNLSYYVTVGGWFLLRHYQYQIRPAHAAFLSVLVTPA